jgi:hypothetical protein
LAKLILKGAIEFLFMLKVIKEMKHLPLYFISISVQLGAGFGSRKWLGNGI